MAFEEADTIFDDVSYPTPITGISGLDKILGVLLGSVGVIGVSAVVVAAIMNPNFGKKLGRITGVGAQKVYDAANLVWQILEPWIRKKFPDAANSEKMDKLFDAVDQGFDLIGILVNNSGLRALFKKSDDNRY
jgi:hypothetical protein